MKENVLFTEQEGIFTSAGVASGKNRRRCLFEETCSHFVFSELKNNGFIPGVKAFLKRYKQCRPIMVIENQEFVLLSDKTLIARNQTNL